MILPTIHTNGTSLCDLLTGYDEARHAVADALSKLEAVEFNGRDYYPQGAAAWKAATEEHAERCLKLRQVLAELGHICAYLMDIQDKRSG